MLHIDVEKIITKYVHDVSPLFADKFERWPTSPNADRISDALYGMEQIYQGLGCEKEAQECSQAAAEIQLRKNN